MTTKSRVLIENAAYHIVIRGNRREPVFSIKEDYEKYLKLLWKYKNRYKAKIYAYCLMENHVHIILEPSCKLTLKKIMHGMNLSYSKWFNIRYDKCGHLWQGRFKSFVIQKDQYLLNCITYIEHNPVRAKICQRAEDYPWSSYKARVLGKNNKLLDDLIL
ncbi:MAG: transposase [Candidatus Omnitrophota bacterium]